MGVTVREKVKGSGEWWVFVAHKGNRKAQKVGAKRDANSLAASLRETLLTGRSSNIFAPSFAEYAERWLDTYCHPPALAKATYDKRVGHFKNYLNPLFGTKNITSISRPMLCEKLIIKHRNGLSATMIEALIQTMSGMFNQALDDEIITSNPVSGVTKRLKLQRKQKKEVNPLTITQCNKVLSAVKMYPLFLTLFRTGMRIGEVTALEWGDVNFEQGYIRVQRGMSGSTKTYKSRNVEILDNLASVLVAEKMSHKKAKFKDSSRPELIFQYRGKPIDHRKIRKAFYSALDRLKIEKRRVHDIRHSYASNLISNGAPLNYVKEQMGHSSIRITVDTYGRYIPSNGKSHLEMFEDNGSAKVAVEK